MSNVTTITVRTQQHDYPIHIGYQLDYASYLKKISCSSFHIVTDARVYKHHGAALKKQLDKAKLSYHIHILKGYEATKSISGYEELLDKILAKYPDRQSCIVAWGGGVMGDLAGFAAATLLRGVTLIQIPTTLLAQVDSSVGGKTGINMKQGKNLTGAFYQPSMVLIDYQMLETLPKREMQSGYAEIVKYGLINDATFFGWLKEYGTSIINHDQEALLYAITTSCRAKAAIVQADEREVGSRALLNLGHSFGHALEQLTHYDSKTLLHGEAVAMGIVIAFHFAELSKICAKGCAQIVAEHFHTMGMKTNPYHLGLTLNAKKLTQAMLLDKKNKRGKLTLILPEKIGRSIIKADVSEKVLQKKLTKILESYPKLS